MDFTFRTHVTREAPSPNTILTTDFALMEAAGAVSRISDEPREKNTCALEKKAKRAGLDVSGWVCVLGRDTATDFPSAGVENNSST